MNTTNIQQEQERYYDLLAPSYRQRSNCMDQRSILNKFAPEWRSDCDLMEKCVSEVLQDARIVADIGCGPSVIPSCMEFEVVYLVDSSKAMLSIAQSRLCPRSPVITFQAHAQHLPIPDVTCDAVLCCNLLSHLSSIDFSNTLNELCRIVKPEGVLLICDSMHPFPGRAIQEGENIQIRSIAGIGCFRIYKEYRQPDEFLKHLVNGSILINRGHRYLYAIKWQKYPKPT